MSKPLTGYQKDLVQNQERQKALAAKQLVTPTTLDPDFPYVSASFDPGAWGIPANPQPLKK